MTTGSRVCHVGRYDFEFYKVDVVIRCRQGRPRTARYVSRGKSPQCIMDSLAVTWRMQYLQYVSKSGQWKQPSNL